jgi:transposase
LGNFGLKDEALVVELTESMVETIQSAARKLTGFLRRQFQAETALRYCNGKARKAEEMLGWGRAAVETGLNELRTGIRCCDNFSARGRHKSEKQNPQLAAAIHALVEPTSQADPKFQTPLAFTRLTAKAVQEQLAAQGVDSPPAERTVYRILNRLGYSLRRVRKTKPQKKSPKPTRSSLTSKGSMPSRPATKKRSASRSTPKPK